MPVPRRPVAAPTPNATVPSAPPKTSSPVLAATRLTTPSPRSSADDRISSTVVMLSTSSSTVSQSTASTGLLVFGGALGTVAFGVGAATGRRGTGIGVASSLAVLAYLFNYLSSLVGAPWMESLSPFSWYIGNDPLINGFDGGGLALLAALAIVAGVGGWVPFRRRNLMV